MIDYWNNCFDDLHILKPAWATLESVREQAMVYLLLHEEGAWGELHRNSRRKYKQLLQEISPIDLTNLMKLAL